MSPHTLQQQIRVSGLDLLLGEQSLLLKTETKQAAVRMTQEFSWWWWISSSRVGKNRNQTGQLVQTPTVWLNFTAGVSKTHIWWSEVGILVSIFYSVLKKVLDSKDQIVLGVILSLLPWEPWSSDVGLPTPPEDPRQPPSSTSSSGRLKTLFQPPTTWWQVGHLRYYNPTSGGSTGRKRATPPRPTLFEFFFLTFL